MVCNERGMALVSVVLILSVLLTLAHVLAEKVWQSTRQLIDADKREQVLWAAQAGIESARQQLAASYCSSGGWHNLLTSGAAQAYPAAPTWVTEINGTPVEIYLRDNPDGDGDVHTDNDLKIFVLARAQGQRGIEAIVESLCGFVVPAVGYTARPGQSATASSTGLSDQPVSTYGIAD